MNHCNPKKPKNQEQVGNSHCDASCELRTLHTSCHLHSPGQVKGIPRGASTCSRRPQTNTARFGWAPKSPAGNCPLGTGVVGDTSCDHTRVIWIFSNAWYVVKELWYLSRPLSGWSLAHIYQRDSKWCWFLASTQLSWRQPLAPEVVLCFPVSSANPTRAT